MNVAIHDIYGALPEWIAQTGARRSLRLLRGKVNLRSAKAMTLDSQADSATLRIGRSMNGSTVGLTVTQ